MQKEEISNDNLEETQKEDALDETLDDTLDDTLDAKGNKGISRSDSSSSVSSTEFILNKLVPWIFKNESFYLLGKDGKKSLLWSLLQALLIIPFLISVIALVFYGGIYSL